MGVEQQLVYIGIGELLQQAKHAFNTNPSEINQNYKKIIFKFCYYNKIYVIKKIIIT